MEISPLPDIVMEPLIRAALLEDLGRAGDLTSQATIPADQTGEGVILARQAGIVSGMAAAALAFRLVDPALSVTLRASEGQAVQPGDIILELSGPVRSLLSGERVALNLLCHLSGVASLTARYCEAVAGTTARITCTRKSLPGMRALQKLAVRAGGGSNHRFGLDDAILIKDNHIAATGDIVTAVRRARAFTGHLVKAEVEVDTLDQLRQVLPEKPDAVLLDNMTLEELKEAVRMTAGAVTLEASGGVTLDSVGNIARTGVDYISAGALTHSATALDLSLDLSV